MNRIITQLENIGVFLKHFSFSCMLCHHSASQHSPCSIYVMIQTALILLLTPKSWRLGTVIVAHHHITPSDVSANLQASSELVCWLSLNQQKVISFSALMPHIKNTEVSYLTDAHLSAVHCRSILVYNFYMLCVYDGHIFLHGCLALSYLSTLNLLSNTGGSLPLLNDSMTP